MRDVEALLRSWIDNVTDEELVAELRQMDASEDRTAVNDAFFKDLSFGTGGLRGIVGAGSNRMNIHTVGRASQGFADYLNANYDHPSMAIARDSRHKGQLFVEHAASVFAANGIHVYVYPRLEPTPTLSWAVRYLHCSGGVCVTASHNPAPYNGYKAYRPDGCAVDLDTAKGISDAIAEVDIFHDVKTMPFEEALRQGLVEYIDDSVLDAFIDEVADQSVATDAVELAPLKIVYTPLNGSGRECVERILDRIGITDRTVVPSQGMPDGDFPTCPYPNPEVRQALEEGIALCEQVKPDLLLATDPDCDRAGITVKDGDEYVQLSGNETGVLMMDYLAAANKAAGEDTSRKVVVTTIVSTPMVDDVAREYGIEVRRVLTGFKYIGTTIADLEAAGELDRYMLGFEESYGYLTGTYVREKDAVDASMIICQMAQYYKAKGMNLVQAIESLYEKYGYYECRMIGIEYPGASGAVRMNDIMEGLRTSGLESVGGFKVEGFIDYATGVNGLPCENVLEFDLAGGNKIMARPSGTEPKIRLYSFGKGATRAEAAAVADGLMEAGKALLA